MDSYTRIQNDILRNRALSRDARFLYTILRSYAWQKDWCYPSYPRLMADLDCSRSHLWKCIRELEATGLIEITYQGGQRPSRYTLTNQYTPVTVPQQFAERTAEPPQQFAERTAEPPQQFAERTAEPPQQFAERTASSSQKAPSSSHLKLLAVRVENPKKTQRKKTQEEDSEDVPADPLRETWEKTKHELKAQMTLGNYNTYIRDTQLIALDDTTATLEAVDATIAEWLRRTMARHIIRALGTVLGTPRVLVVTDRTTRRAALAHTAEGG